MLELLSLTGAIPGARVLPPFLISFFVFLVSCSINSFRSFFLNKLFSPASESDWGVGWLISSIRSQVIIIHNNIFNIFNNSWKIFLDFWHFDKFQRVCFQKTWALWLLLFTVCLLSLNSQFVVEFELFLLRYSCWGSAWATTFLFAWFSEVFDPIPLDCLLELRNLDEDWQSRWFKPVL